MLLSVGHLTKSRYIFGYHNKGAGMVLASRGQKPGMLWNILQFSGHLSGPKMPTVLRLRNPVADDLICPNVGHQWSSVTRLTRMACGPIFWDMGINYHCCPSTARILQTDLKAVLLLHDQNEEWGHWCPILKGNRSPAQINVYSHKKKLLEFLFWTLLPCL